VLIKMSDEGRVGLDLQYNKPYYDARLKYTDAIGKSIERVQEAIAAGDFRSIYMTLISYSEMTYPFLQEPGPETRKKLLGEGKDLDGFKKDLFVHFNQWLRNPGRVEVETVFFSKLMVLYRYLMICTRLLLLPVGSNEEFDITDEAKMDKFANQMLKEMGL
jgi:hypothetical protein